MKDSLKNPEYSVKGARILIVDDEVRFTESMSKILTRSGHIATTAHCGADALKMLKSNSFDVVILDLKMPELDGIDTLKEIKKLDLNAEVLILTGHGTIDSALEAIRLGAYDYLFKPCDTESLLIKIEDVQHRLFKKTIAKNAYPSVPLNHPMPKLH